MKRRTAALLLLIVACSAVADIDKPWQELDPSSGGDPALVGPVLLALGDAAWRLFVSGNLGSLLGSEVHFLLGV
jgi:hypothetical protein